MVDIAASLNMLDTVYVKLKKLIVETRSLMSSIRTIRSAYVELIQRSPGCKYEEMIKIIDMVDNKCRGYNTAIVNFSAEANGSRAAANALSNDQTTKEFAAAIQEMFDVHVRYSMYLDEINHRLRDSICVIDSTGPIKSSNMVPGSNDV